MDDYIRRLDAIDALESMGWYHQAPNKEMVHGANSTEHQAWYKEEDVFYAIEAVPTADVVAVVRCRECKHSIMHKFPYNYEKVLACNDPHGVTIRAVKPMHFCSYGERKDGGHDE